MSAATKVAAVGFGPRNHLLLLGLIQRQIADVWRGKPDSTPREYDIFEQQEKVAGPGTAFQRNVAAALNTSLPGPTDYDKSGLSGDQISILDHMTDISFYYKKVALADPDRLEKLKAENVSTAILYAKATKDGDLDTSGPCGPRNLVGEALDAMLDYGLMLKDKHLPWITVNIHYGAEVLDDATTDPIKHNLIVKEDGKTSTYGPYDVVSKAAGMTWAIPVKGHVAENAVTDVPAPEVYEKDLQAKGRLGQDGKIKDGTRYLFGGASLGAFDPVGMFLARTNIVKVDPSHKDFFIIDEEEARKHPELITMFNRSSGGFAPSRHADTAQTPDDIALFTPEMILANQIDANQDVFPIFYEWARICAATKLGKLPEEIEPKRATPEQLAVMVDENERLAADPSTLTETALVRACLLSCFFALAMGSNQKALREDLARKYPLLVRDSWRGWRAMTFNPTHGINITKESSENHLSAVRAVMAHVTSAPRPIHLMITRLVKLGTISWRQGSFEQVKWDATKKRFVLDGFEAHGLVAPRVLTSKTDKLSDKLIARSKKPIPPDPIYRKGRFLTSALGGTMTVMELGLPGHGQQRDAKFENAQWMDTNSYEGAHDLMPRVCDLVRLIERLISSGFKDAVGIIDRFYREILPKPADFNKQTAALAEAYHDSNQIRLFSHVVAKVYPGGRDFGPKMIRAAQAGQIDQMIDEIRALGGDTNEAALEVYFDEMGKIEYNPHTLESFEKSTPDYSRDQLAAIKAKVDQALS